VAVGAGEGHDLKAAGKRVGSRGGGGAAEAPRAGSSSGGGPASPRLGEQVGVSEGGGRRGRQSAAVMGASLEHSLHCCTAWIASQLSCQPVDVSRYVSVSEVGTVLPAPTLALPGARLAGALLIACQYRSWWQQSSVIILNL